MRHMMMIFRSLIVMFIYIKNNIKDVGSTADFADVSDFCYFSLILDTPGTRGTRVVVPKYHSAIVLLF